MNDLEALKERIRVFIKRLDEHEQTGDNLEEIRAEFAELEEIRAQYAAFFGNLDAET